MIFDIHASATTWAPVRSSPELLHSAMAHYRPQVRVVGTDSLDAVLHVEDEPPRRRAHRRRQRPPDALHAGGDDVRAASISGARDDERSDEATDVGDDED